MSTRRATPHKALIDHDEEASLMRSAYRLAEVSAVLGLTLCVISFHFFLESRTGFDDTARAMNRGYMYFFGVPGLAALTLSGAAVTAGDTSPKWALVSATTGLAVGLLPLIIWSAFFSYISALDVSAGV